ncbi:hypothetical protein PWT90_05401 [Aphanocladium album]|nr:hypothetical protein PWT90_05401 [Aphanocladium album]
MAQSPRQSEQVGQSGSKKRRRPPLSCEQCRRRKIKCDRAEPCNHCVRSRTESCTYVPTQNPKSRTRRATRPEVLGEPSQSTSAPLPQDVAAIRGARRSGMAQPETRSSALRTTNAIVAGPHQNGSNLEKSAISKDRYLGQSHWMNIAASFPVELSMLRSQESSQGELFQTLCQCKSVSQKIKSIQIQPLSSLDVGKNGLPQELCDDLVNAYLATFEGVFRVVHVDTFKKEYSSYWSNPSAATDAFVVLMQLCMALGSCVRERTATLKSRAVQWIHEAQIWLFKPPEKAQMTMTGIQILCLLSLAKMVCGVSPDLTWIMAGSALRTAMHMGLHRDPSHLGKMPVYKAEMRRRLWVTILELNLQYSFEAGGMPLVSCEDYDTLPPADLNDDQLSDIIDDVESRPSSGGIATQMSVPLEIFKSFPVRLKLLQYVNGFRSNIDYEKTLEFNSDLTNACRSFTTTIGALNPVTNRIAASIDREQAISINPFHISLAEVTLYRCFHALHYPVLLEAFDDPRFYFSRKMCLDGALKIADLWRFSQPRPASGSLSDFERLTIHGTGMFKNISVQSSCIMALELIHDKSGRSSGLGYLPAARHSDLRACLESALDWTLRRMRAGELTAKPYCFLSACAAHADALEQGMDKTATMELLVRRTTEAARTGLSLLNEVAREAGILATETEMPRQDLVADDTMQALMAGWDGGWAWDESDDWMWNGAWSQLNVPAPMVDGNEFADDAAGYSRCYPAHLVKSPAAGTTPVQKLSVPSPPPTSEEPPATHALPSPPWRFPSGSDLTTLAPLTWAAMAARRVKCDEARPACLRCAKGGFECRGYTLLPASQRADSLESLQESLNRMQSTAAGPGRRGVGRGQHYAEPEPPHWEQMEAVRYSIAWGRVVMIQEDPSISGAWAVYSRQIGQLLALVNGGMKGAITCQTDSELLLRRIYGLVFYDLAVNASAWRLHALGYLALVQHLGGVRALMRNCYHRLSLTQWAMLKFAIAVNSTTPPSMQLRGFDAYTDDDMVKLASHRDHLDFDTPIPLLQTLRRISQLRCAGADGTYMRSAPDRVVRDVLNDILRFDAVEWARGKKHPAAEGELLAHAQIHQEAILLYGILSLPRSAVASWSDVVSRLRPPTVHAFDHVRSCHRRKLLDLMYPYRGTFDSRLDLTWSLLVAGVSLGYDGSAQDRDFVRESMLGVWSNPITRCSPILCLDKLIIFWKSGKAAWDDCFDEPTPCLG